MSDKVWLVLLLLMGYVRLGIAQQPDSQESFSTDTVFIKAKSPQKRIESLPFTVSSISTLDLKNSAADIKDVLNRTSGVRVLQNGGLGSALNVTLNGFSGQQVKIFLDGIPMDNFSNSYSLSSIPVNSIDRIDIYKGVVPVELGTDALGGVINVITNKRLKFLDASYSYGSFGTHRPSINGAYTHMKTGWTVRGSLNYNYSKNNYKVYVPIVRNNTIEYYDNVPRFHNRYKSGSIRLETGVVMKDFADQLLFGIIASMDDNQVQNGNTMNTVYGGILKNSKTIAPTLKYAKKNLFTDGLDVSFYTSYNYSKSNVIDTLEGVTYNWLGERTITPGSNAGEFLRTYTTLKDKEANLGTNVSYHFSNKHSVVLNYLFDNFQRTSFDKINPNKIENQFPKKLTKNVLGLGYTFNLNSKWNTTLFGKYYSVLAKGEKLYDFALGTQKIDKFKSRKSSVGYGLATTLLPLDGLQLKLSYEHAYRMPTAEEIFGDGLFVESNPDLSPEESHNINFGTTYGYHFHHGHEILIGGSFIFRHAKDLIYQIATISSPVTHYANLSNTRTLGVEGNISYKWKRLFHIDGNITFQDITDQSDFVYVNSTTNGGKQKNYQKGFRVPNIPYFFSNVNTGISLDNVFFKASNLTLNYRLNYTNKYFLTWSELGSKDSKKIIPTQVSHDVELIYSLQDGRYNLSLECTNLTNARLYDKFYLQKPGRAFTVKFRYNLF